MSPFDYALGLTVLAVIVLLGSTTARGRRRLVLQRSSYYVGVPALTASLVLLPFAFAVPFSDGLSLAGLGVSLLFGIGTKSLGPLSMRVRVGVVIPSRVPFHTELRAGLKQGLAPLRVEIFDDYLVNSRAMENLVEFVPSLRRTLAWRADYLVICSPSVDLISTDHVVKMLKQHRRRGGRIIFIDNEPEEQVRPQLGQYGHVRADVEAAALLLASYIEQSGPANAKVLVVNGPPYSDPAERYRKALETRAPKLQVTFAESNGWSEQGTYAATGRHLDAGNVPDFVLCGNDVMAFGAVRAIRERRKGKTGLENVMVLGYNGIARALFAIAEQDNPLAATVAIPPGAYGQEVAAMLVSDAARVFGGTALHHCCIPIGDERLIDRNNVELVLED